jgi:hypothetical protein
MGGQTTHLAGVPPWRGYLRTLAQPKLSTSAQAPHLVCNLKPEKPPYGVVVPIDLTTLTTQPPIRVLSYPFSITAILITADGRTAAAAANTAVIPIDLQTRKASKPIRVPAGSAIGLLP